MRGAFKPEGGPESLAMASSKWHEPGGEALAEPVRAG